MQPPRGDDSAHERRQRSLPVVDSLPEAMAWGQNGLRRLLQNNLEITPGSLKQQLTNNTVSMSSCFSGVAAPEVSTRMIEHAATTVFSDDETRPLRISPVFVIEKSPKCRDELLAMEQPPKHVFGDIVDFAPNNIRRILGCSGSARSSSTQVREVVPFCKMRLTAHCYRCNSNCTLRRTAMHVAGSPCQDHSIMNQARNTIYGKHIGLFYLWCALMRTMRIILVFHENVWQFGEDELRRCLGDCYVVIRLRTCPSMLGWPSIRVRQVTVLILRAWENLQIQGALPEDDESFITALDLEATFHAAFDRACGITLMHYCIATEKELVEDRAWAGSRVLVQEARAQHPEIDVSSGKAFLTVNELDRMRYYLNKPNRPHVVDLNQNPLERKVCSIGKALHTLTKGAGILWCYDVDRALVPSELWSAQGFPIDDDAVRAAGTRCMFSRGVLAPSSRTRASQIGQIGNTMHVNVIGGVMLATLARVPVVGKDTTPVGTSLQKRPLVSDAEGGSALGEHFRSLMRRRRQ